MLTLFLRLYRFQAHWLSHIKVLSPLLSLAARLYVAQVFLASAMTKLSSWENTLFLFEEEYHVPLLPPEWAAYLGTGGELLLPLLLAPGLMGRFAAIGLFVVNAVAAISLSDIAPAALMQHIYWGSLLLLLATEGAGRLSIDHWISNWIKTKQSDANS